MREVSRGVDKQWAEIIYKIDLKLNIVLKVKFSTWSYLNLTKGKQMANLPYAKWISFLTFS